MFNLEILFLILFISLNQSRTIWMLNPVEVCNNIETECVGSYNKNDYRVKCNILNCTGNFNWKCSNDHCGKSKKACKELKDLRIMVSFIDKPIEFGKNLRLFKSIRNCEFQARNEWKSSDHCLNEEKCIQKTKIPSRVNNILEFDQKIFCQCSGKHTYECFHGNKFYCSINEKKCQRLKMIKNETKHLKHVKNCKTKATYYEKNYSLFG
jgi:hypothetical protein